MTELPPAAGIQLEPPPFEPEPVQLEPILIELRQHHPYRSRGKGRRGCAVCGEAKTHFEHLGPPPSLRVLGSGNEFEYQALKKAWQQLLAERLEVAGVPRHLGRVLVEGEAIFPDRRKRDQGNHRFMVEKALGDALVNGSPPDYVSLRWAHGHVEGLWLIDDDWSRYEFGRLAARYEKGVAGLNLMLFPGAGGA